jgi:hypothetical protein
MWFFLVGANLHVFIICFMYCCWRSSYQDGRFNTRYQKASIFAAIIHYESLNSDGHQFHQYKQLPLILLQLTEHKKDHYIYNICLNAVHVYRLIRRWANLNKF